MITVNLADKFARFSDHWSPKVVETVDGYDVKLNSGIARAGEEAELDFEITKDGEPVEVEEYLGAGGHLVAGLVEGLHFGACAAPRNEHSSRSSASG